MSTEQTFETKRIDHLGIVAGICHEIGLMAAIDQAAGSSERKVSGGAAVQAMVFNGLGFTSRALYLMLQDLDNKPVDLLSAPSLVAEDCNDDTLGRSLDQLFGAGVTEVCAQVAQRARETSGIEHRFVHLDRSSVQRHGQYSAAAPEIEAIEITSGSSKDHRPDLKQVVVKLITGHRLDGAANRQRLGETRWLTRVPETLAAANRLLAETDADEMTALPDDYASLELPSDFGGIAQRWLVVSSPVAAYRQNKPCCAG